jgi:hypothetical protein
MILKFFGSIESGFLGIKTIKELFERAIEHQVVKHNS